MLKCYNPKQEWTYESPLAPGTIFHYRANTGPMIWDNFADLMVQVVNSCVTKVENIEVSWTETKLDDPDDPKSERTEVEVTKVFTPEDPFYPAKFPSLKLSALIPQSICTPLMWAIWSKTTLSKRESGE